MSKTQNEDNAARRKRSMFAWLRGSFLTGLVVIAPIGLTLWLIWTVAGWVDSWVLPFVPIWLRPDQYVGLSIRGIGVLVFLIFTILVGWMAKGIIGKSMIMWAEGLVEGLPVVRSVYKGPETDRRDRLCPIGHLLRQGLSGGISAQRHLGHRLYLDQRQRRD